METALYNQSKPLKDSQKAMVLQAIDFIEKNLKNPIQIEDVTFTFDKSHWYFQRLFRGVSGLSLGHYVRARRLTEAARLLKHSDQKIIEIAKAFDFGSQEAFTRAFKRFSGLNPHEYRGTTDYIIYEKLDRISPDDLDFFWTMTQEDPEVVCFSNEEFLGLKFEIDPHLSEESDPTINIKSCWDHFFKNVDIQSKTMNLDRGTQHVETDTHQFFGFFVSQNAHQREKK